MEAWGGRVRSFPIPDPPTPSQTSPPTKPTQPQLQGKGHITRAQFIEGYNKYFVGKAQAAAGAGAGAGTEESVDPALGRLLAKLDPKGKDRIDYIEWSNTLTLKDVPDLTR